MKRETVGFFYDGKSSEKKEVGIILNTNSNYLILKVANEDSYQWKLDDVTLEKKGTKLFFSLTTDVSQSVFTDDIVFIETIIAFRKEKLSFYQKLIDLGYSFHAGIAVFILLLIGLSYVYFLPWIAEKSVVLIPEEFDTKIGNTFFEENLLFGAIDSTKTIALNDFAKELELSNTKKLKFTIVDSDIVNAFALPDGNIVIYTGIINKMKDYDELVGLIGHEAAHVNHRHSIKMLCRNLSGYLFVSTVLGDVNGVMAVIGDNVNSLQSLSFSRKFEQQADVEGFNTVVLNKIRPQGMSNLLKRLQENDDSIVPEFLSSHPITENRIQYVDELIKSKSYSYKRNPKLELLFRKIKH